LRVRLELCVLESFVSEAIVPFVQEKGLSWVLPLHETVETFLAGTVFAVATNFILLGSTKIFAVLVAYSDVLLGLPARLGGWALWSAAIAQLVDHDAANLDALASGRRQPNAAVQQVFEPPAGDARPGKRPNQSGADAVGDALASLASSWPWAPRPPPPPPPSALAQLSDVVRHRRGSGGGGRAACFQALALAVLGVGGVLRLCGTALSGARRITEAFDTFVGRYLVYATFGYVVVKVLHFKVFPEFPF
jgi:hypothetical protein